MKIIQFLFQVHIHIKLLNIKLEAFNNVQLNICTLQNQTATNLLLSIIKIRHSNLIYFKFSKLNRIKLFDL